MKLTKNILYIVIISCSMVIIALFMLYIPYRYISFYNVLNSSHRINKGYYLVLNTKNIKVNDEMVFIYNKETFVKKCVARESDIIKKKYNNLYINGKAITETQDTDDSSITLKHDEFYAINNEPNSYDSRDIGSINIKDVKGKVLLYNPQKNIELYFLSLYYIGCFILLIIIHRLLILSTKKIIFR